MFGGSGNLTYGSVSKQFLSVFLSMSVFQNIRIFNELEHDHHLPALQVLKRDAQSEASLALVMPNVSMQLLLCISLLLENPSACLFF
jgi:hypothetical protein